MIVVDCKQGSAEWVRARLGIPTASGFARILTKQGKASAQADRYMRELLAEHFTGEPAEGHANAFMERGQLMEAQARSWYEYDRDVTVQRVGFCLRDDGLVGASPDALVGEDGLLELKCPSAAVQVEYLLGGVEGEYWQQVQGQLYVTGRKWCDLVAFNPVLPPVVKRYEPDEEYQALLEAALGTFVQQLRLARERLIGLGCRAPSAPVPLAVGAAVLDEEPF